MLYLWFVLIVRPIVRLLLGVSVHGREHLHFTQPTLFVANHNSHLDAALLLLAGPAGDFITGESILIDDGYSLAL